MQIFTFDCCDVRCVEEDSSSIPFFPWFPCGDSNNYGKQKQQQKRKQEAMQKTS